MKFNRHTLPNVVVALAKALRAWWRGPILCPDTVVANRLLTCYGCPDFCGSSGQCKRCTCFVSIKTLLSSESCPAGKWGTLDSHSAGGRIRAAARKIISP